MTKTKGGKFEGIIELELGEYEYKYIVDGKWLKDDTRPTVQADGTVNNVLKIPNVSFYVERAVIPTIQQQLNVGGRVIWVKGETSVNQPRVY